MEGDESTLAGEEVGGVSVEGGYLVFGDYESWRLCGGWCCYIGGGDEGGGSGGDNFVGACEEGEGFFVSIEERVRITDVEAAEGLEVGTLVVELRHESCVAGGASEFFDRVD